MKALPHKRQRTKEYRAWCKMKERCENKRAVNYSRYGGRGIVVCDRWRKSFTYFLLDMRKAPNDSYSLDRINNDGNYEPGNCRWATSVQQNNNSRRNKFIIVNGESKTISQWCNLFGLSYSVAWRKLNVLKHSPESVFTKTIAG